MNKIYVVAIDCTDENDMYTDYFTQYFKSEEEAKELIEKSIMWEMETLGEGFHRDGNLIIREEDTLIISKYKVLSFVERDPVISNYKLLSPIEK